MKIKIENNYVIGFCTKGDIEDSIEIENIPDEFEKYYNAYYLVDGQLVLDENRKNIVDEEGNEKK